MVFHRLLFIFAVLAATLTICLSQSAQSKYSDIFANQKGYSSQIKSSGPLTGWVNFATSLSSTSVKDHLDISFVVKSVKDGLAPCCSGLLFNYIKDWGMGMVIVGALGITFAILFSIIGIIFCCCRCCGNCGGTRVQEKESRVERNCLIVTMLFTLVFALTGIVFIYISTSNLSTVPEKVRVGFSTLIDDVDTFQNNSFKEIDGAIDNFKVPRDFIFDELDRFNVTVGLPTKAFFENSTDPIFALIDKSTDDLNSTMNYLRTLNGTIYKLADEVTTVNRTEVQDANEKLNDLRTECSSCSTPGDIDITFEYSKLVEDIKNPIIITRNLLNTLTKNTDDIRTAIDDFLGVIESDSADAIDSVRNEISGHEKDTRSRLDTFQKDFDEKFSSFSSEVRRYVDEYIGADSYATKYVSYIKPIGIVLASMLLLVWIIGAISLCCGISAIKKVHPSDRSTFSNRAGNLMAVSAYAMMFMQFFLWLVAGILFIVGTTGNNVCEPILNHDIYAEVLDSKNEIFKGSYNMLGRFLNTEDDVLFGDVVKGCANDEALWNVFKLDSSINITDLIDVVRDVNVSGQFSGQFNFSNTIDEIVSSDSLDGITEFIGLRPLDLLSTLNSPLTGTDLDADLKNLADLNTTHPEHSSRINATVVSLQKLKTELERINSTVQKAKSDLYDVSDSVSISSGALRELNLTFYDIEDNLSSFDIMPSILKIIDEMSSAVNDFTTQARKWVYNDIGKCKPILTAVDSAWGSVCVESLNDGIDVFWFSLGWTAFFAVIWIIVGIRLAKYFRTMEAEFYKYAQDDINLHEMKTKEPLYY